METTLQEAKGQWKETVAKDGGVCPCCDRWGKIYGRNINKTMANSLAWLARYSELNSVVWVDVPNTAPKSVIRSNQLATLRWWNLVERQESSDSKLKHSGMWRVTSLGREFVKGEITVPKQVFTYNGDAVGYGPKQTNFADCLDTDFDYEELMQTIAPVTIQRSLG